MFTADEYLDAKRLGAAYAGQKGSPNTIATYRTALKLAEFCADKPLNQITTDDMFGILERAEAHKYSQSQVNGMITAMRGAFDWAIGVKKYEGINPTHAIKTTATKRKIPPILSYDQQECLYAATAEVGGDKYVLILSLMGYSGLRLGEAISLRKDEVLDDGILIMGKGSKHAYVPVKKDLLQAVKDFMIQHPHTDYVFYGEDRSGIQNQPLSHGAVYKVFDKAVALCDLPKGITPHTLRHSFATHALAKSGRLEIVQKFLRHADPKTTLFYAQISPDELKREHEKLWD